MGISLDLYDFFAHIIPGGVFLVAFLYGFQEDWLISSSFAELSLVQLIGPGLISYILGYVIDPLGNRWHQLFRPKGPRNAFSKTALRSLTNELPWLIINEQTLSYCILLAYAKSHNLLMAQEIKSLFYTTCR